MPRAQEAQERRVSVSHGVSQSAWAPRSRSTFLPDSPQAHPCGLCRDIPKHRVNLKEAAPAHPCARGLPFILNITSMSLKVLK